MPEFFLLQVLACESSLSSYRISVGGIQTVQQSEMNCFTDIAYDKDGSSVFQTRADTKGRALTAVNGRSLLASPRCQQTLPVSPAPADSLKGDGANATSQMEF